MDDPAVARGPNGRRAYLLALGGPAVVVAVIALTNLPALIGMVQPDPQGIAGVMARHVTAGFLPGTWYTDSDIGTTAQALGHRAALDWLHGQVPWWNPFEGIGSPLAAEMQSAALFPPVLLFAFAKGSLYFHLFMEVSAGLATWSLLREIRMSRGIATVGGVLFGLNGTFSWLPHAPMNPVALLPLLLLGIERTFREPRRDSGWVIIALALALSLYAGFPEVTYLDTLVGVVWAALRLAQSKGSRAEVGLRLALGAVIGLLISLPLALPLVQYFPSAYVGYHADNTFGYVHFSAFSLPALGLPYLYGPVEGFDQAANVGTFWAQAGGFVTASTFALALAGLIGARRERGLRIMLAAVSFVVLAWVFGVPGFHVLTTVLPYMVHIGITRYSAPDWELLLILLACFGLDSLGRDRRAKVGALAGGVMALAFGAAMLLGPAGKFAASVARVAPGAHSYAVAMTLWAGAIVVVATGFCLLGRRGWTVGAVAVLLVVDAVVMAGIPQLSAPRNVQIETAPAAFLARHLGFGRYFSIGTYHSDYGSYFGLGQLNETDLPVPSDWAKEIVEHLGPNSDPLSFDGVHVVSSSGPSPAAQALANLGAYEALDVRYFVVLDRNPVFGTRAPYPDGLRQVFDDGAISIFALPDPKPYFSTTGGNCKLTPAGRDIVTALCSAPATLVRSELYVPGWSATLNGRPVPVIDHAGLLSAVDLPAGASTVTFTYAPRYIDLAVGGFLLGMIVLVGLPLGRRMRGKRRGRARGPRRPRLTEAPAGGERAGPDSPPIRSALDS
jgi:hypothetical protein